MTGRVYVPDAADAETDRRRPTRGPSILTIVGVAVVAMAAFAITSPGPIAPPNQIVVRPFAPPVGSWEPTTLQNVGTFSDVIQVDGKLVAVGAGLRVDSTPFVWTSADGRTWQQADGRWEPGDLIVGVEAHPDGLFAFGYHLVDPLRSTEVNPRVWNSTDGSEWTPVDTDGLPSEAMITDAAHVDGSLIAVGWEGAAVLEPRVPPPDGVTVKVWRSEDGIEWTDVTPVDATWFHDVASTDDGFVLSGTVDGTPTIWRGTDRFEPSSNGDPRLTAHTAIASVDSADGLLTIVRLTRDIEGLTSVWSVDGDTWTEVDLDGRPDSAGWIRQIGNDLYAGPSFTRSIYPAGPEVWISDDGDEWIGVEVTGGQTQWPPSIVTAVARYDDDLLAFGSRQGSPTVWYLADG